MAEITDLKTSAAGTANPAANDIKNETAPTSAATPQTCASRKCINKPKSKAEEGEEEEDKKSKKNKKQKRKQEYESECSDSSDSSSSSDSSDSESDDSDSDSSSSDDDKKGKKKSKKSSKKSKIQKDKKKSKSKSNKSRKSRQVIEDDTSSSSSSSSSSIRESSTDSSDSNELATLRKDLESQGFLKSSRKGGSLLKKMLKLASKKDVDEDERSQKSKKSDRKAKLLKSKSDRKDKKEDDSETPKYKRLDEVWDENLYDYRLKATSDKKKADEWEKYIFTVRRMFDCENHYESTLVDIKSVPLRECLKIIMDGVSGVSLVEKTPRLAPDMLFLYLEDFRDYSKLLTDRRKSCNDKKVKKALKTKITHLEALIAYLDKDYDELKKTLYPMLENGTITFDLLWALFKPNTLAYRATYGDDNQPRAFKIEYTFKHRDHIRGLFYDIEGNYLDYDGENFGTAYINGEVPQFQGARKITSLACYPLKYHANEEALKAKLIDRGKKFLQLSGQNYKVCKGICYVKKEDKVLKANINGRCMVDPKTFRRIQPNYPLSEVVARDIAEEDIECRCEKPDQPRRSKEGKERLFMINKKGEKKEDQEIEVIELSPTDDRAPDNIVDPVKRAEATKMTFSEQDLLIASPVLPGFCFSEKLWVEIAVSTIHEVQWNDGAFDSLVIPDKHKSIVKALVSAHGQHASKSIDDVVSGKGKGLVAVLHGKPGLGKTLTCEAVSDLLKRPLYTVSAGDLGTSATHLEGQLQVILDVAHTWGAVLLLDEADVFLEERSSHDVHRNALVSIFLRLLEYFQGILFLTTNRVETFDEAFVSRIHLSLRYGELTIQARKSIWKTFITKVAESAKLNNETTSSSTAISETSSIGIATPETTSSTPNSGTATPAPASMTESTISENPPMSPVTPTSTSSTTSIDSDKSDKTVTAAPPIEDPSLATTTDDSTTHPLPTASPTPTLIPAVSRFTEANYIELSRVDLNGRQIKNLVKTAQALALYEGVPMNMGHLRRCIEVGRSFELDLKGGRGWEDAMRSYT